MVFSILVAADLYGTKTNFELHFPVLPSFVEFKAKAEAVLATESSLRRPTDLPLEPFTPARMQLFDEKVDLWVDFVASSQLKEYCQVYVFQKETSFHREVQSKIPPPCKTIPVLGSVTSPHSPLPAPVSPYTGSPYAVASPYAVGSPYAATASPLIAQIAPLPPILPPIIPPAIPTGEATHADKVRYTFNKLDTNRDGLVVQGAFVTMLSNLRVDFTPEVMVELFGKADSNKDDLVSYSEFQRFCELYPTVLDSLYYRSKDDEETERHAQIMAAANTQLQAAQDQHRLAQEQTGEAANHTIAMQSQVEVSNKALADAEAGERDAKALLDTAQAETNAVRATVGQRAQDVAQAKEHTRGQEVRVAESGFEVQTSFAALKSQEAERIKSEQRLADIRELLRQQEEELAVQCEREQRAAAQLEEAENKQKQREAELEEQRQALQLACEHLSVSEKELGDAQDRQREQGVTHLQAKDSVAKCSAKRDEDERDLMKAREIENLKQVLEADADREAKRQEGVCQGLVAQDEGQKAKRRNTEEEEKPLLSEEIRLRFQRDTLEQEEAALRTNHRSFHTSTGRSGAPSASPARALSHSP